MTRADDGMVDVHTLPQLEGAVEDTSRSEPHRLNYSVSTPVTVTIPAIRKLFVTNGWIPYVQPMQEADTSLFFKKEKLGVFVSFTQRPSTPNQSSVNYHPNRINANLPFPADATDVVFDENRPYLSCLTASTPEASSDFFRQQLTSSGWSPLSAADAAAPWPHAELNETLENGIRAYFSFESRDGGYKQPPIVLSLQRGADGKTHVEVKVAPFALPQNLGLARDTVNLPEPDHTKSFGSMGDRDSVRREVQGQVIAEVPAVLAFFRRELAVRNWKEETAGSAITADDVTLFFSTPDETARLRLVRKYDMTIVVLNAQVKEAALAERAKAKKAAEAKFFSDAEATAKQFIAADEIRRAAQAATLSDATLHALADRTEPVPLPDTATDIRFDGAKGALEFDSNSSVKAIATFYRNSLASLGWREQPSVINKSNMAVMEFSRGGKKLSFTAMQMGPKVNVSADGSGLVIAIAAGEAKSLQNSPALPAQTSIEKLEAEPDSALPVPKQHTMSSLGIGKLPGTETPIRRELNASIPAGLNSVLAFYRDELGKRGWKELAERAVIAPDRAQLAFASPDGPAMLSLGRHDDETTVKLAQKIPAAAAKGEIMPKPGQARLMFANVGDSEIALTINKQTFKIAAGAGGPGAKGPSIDLPPGKYQYSVKIAGSRPQSNTIELAANDTWGLMLAPGGDVLPLQVY